MRHGDAHPSTNGRARAQRQGFVFALVSLAAHGTLLAALSWVPITRGAARELASEVDDEPFLMQLDLRATSVLAESEPETEPVAGPVPPVEAPPPEPERMAEVEPEPMPEPMPEPVAPPAEIPPAPVVTSLAEEAPLVAPGHRPDEPNANGDGEPALEPARAEGPATPALPATPPAPVAPAPAPASGGSGTAGLGGLDDGFHLRALRADRPEYPEEARRRNEEGTVTCRLTIDREGRVVEVEIVHSSGSKALDAASVRALKRWRFEPLARLTDRKTVHAVQKLSFELKSVRR